MKNRILFLSKFAVVAGSLSSAHAANIISFNAVGQLTGGMVSGDTAGAPGASAANWNNVNSNGTAYSGTLAAGTVKDNGGVVQATTTVSWSGTGNAAAAGTGTNSTKMFSSDWDLWDSSSNTAVADATFTVSNVPYATYNVYVYINNANDSATRGGNATANGITKSITMFNAASDNPDGANGYTEADSAFTWNAANTEVGSYLLIENVTGSTLTLALSSQNTPTPRLRFSGFQIVQVPEPSHTALTLLGFCGALFIRRRSRA